MDSIEHIRARAAAASAGPWRRHGADVWVDGSPQPLLRGRDGSGESREQADADAEFVAHAREDIVSLLALLGNDSEGADSDPVGSSATHRAPLPRGPRHAR